MINLLREKIKRAIWPHMYKKGFMALGINEEYNRLGALERKKILDRVYKVVVKHFHP